MNESETAGQYQQLLSRLEGLTESSRAAFGDAVQCRRGCALCCHGLFDIGVLDALLLHEAWLRAPGPLRTAIADRAERLLAEIARLRPGWAYPFRVDALEEDEVDRILETLGLVACPVLGEDRSCSLYAARPFYCRVHGLKIRDAGGEADIDTDCELNFTAGPPERAQWPGHDFTELFGAEGNLLQQAGLDPDARFLIPAVTTPRFEQRFLRTGPLPPRS